MPEETKAAMDEASTDMNAFCSSIRKLGQSVETGFSKLSGETRELFSEIAKVRKQLAE